MKHRVGVGALALTLLLAGCSGGENFPTTSTPAPDATEGIESGLAQYYTQELSWSECDSGVQCSTLEVPLDYAKPDGETIELALLRIPTTSKKRQGSLIVNPGGPGASGREYAKNPKLVASNQVREHFDIVGFDPRGVAGSEPALDCVNDKELDELLSSDGTPENDQEIAENQRMLREFAEGCRENSGELLPHIGTANVARDLDILRAALGDSTLTYLGKSYGTYLGAVYAEIFGARTGKLVLDGAVDPAISGQEMALGQVRGFEKSLSSFISWCSDQDDCVLNKDPEKARQELRDFFTDIDEKPLDTGEDGRPLTQGLALYGLILPLYLGGDLGYPLLNSALKSAFEGDGSTLLQFTDVYLSREDDGYKGNQNEAITVINCVDHPEESDVEAIKASLPEFEKASPVFGPLLAWGGLACDPWATQEPQAPAEIRAEDAKPILVLGTTGDPATPYEWAEGLAEQLSSGVLLTREGEGHTAYMMENACIDKAVDTYLIKGETPEPGTRCSP